MSKKLLKGILLGALLVSALPMVASAQITEAPDSCTIRRSDMVSTYLTGCPTGADPQTCDYDDTTAPCALCCTLGIVFYVTDLVFIGLMVAVMIFVLLGAFNILTAGGNPDKVDKGRDFILYALIGFALAILAKGIPAIVSFFLAA